MMKYVIAILVVAVFVAEAQAQRVIYDPQSYYAAAVQAPIVGDVIGGDLTVVSSGDLAVTLANGAVQQAMQTNAGMAQIAMQHLNRQPVIVCVPGSRCQPGYCVAVQPARQAPVIVNRQAPCLPPPPAPNMYVFPAGAHTTVINPPGMVFNNNAPVQNSPPVTQYQGGQSSANWNAPQQTGSPVTQGQGGQQQALGHPCPGCPQCAPPVAQPPVQQQLPALHPAT